VRAAQAAVQARRAPEPRPSVAHVHAAIETGRVAQAKPGPGASPAALPARPPAQAHLAARPRPQPSTPPPPAGGAAGGTRRQPGLNGPAARRIVQPKVGFEFETKWLVFGPSASFHEKTKLFLGTGWYATADVWFPNEEERKIFAEAFGAENIVSTGELEFVTEAVEESTPGRNQLDHAMDEIYQSLIAIGKGIVEHDKGFFTADLARAPGYAGPRGLILATSSSQRQAPAAPQMSAGIKLTHIPKVLRAVAESSTEPVPLFGRDVPWFAEHNPQFKEILDNVERLHGPRTGVHQTPYGQELATFVSKEYRGAIAIIAAHLLWSSNPEINFAKYSTPMLSRTNFGELSELLGNYPNWQQEVLAVLPVEVRQAFNRDPRMFPGSTIPKPYTTWLNEIEQGRDTTDWGQTDLPEWRPQQVGNANDRDLGHVFEFRAVGSRVNARDWKEFALTRFDYIRGLNNASPTPRRDIRITEGPVPFRQDQI
jgi:hypothetical protein